MDNPLIVPKKPDDFDISKQLADKARKDALETIKKHEEKISRIVLAVEAIFIKEEATLGDLMEVVNKINNRSDYVVPRIKIKEVKERFDELTQFGTRQKVKQ